MRVKTLRYFHQKQHHHSLQSNFLCLQPKIKIICVNKMHRSLIFRNKIENMQSTTNATIRKQNQVEFNWSLDKV